MTDQTLEVLTREATGKNENRRLRASGKIPAVLYGTGGDTVPITVDRRKFLELLRTGGSDHSVFLLKRVESDQERHAMIRDMQINPRTREVLHVDFLRVLMDQLIKVQVPIKPVGVPLGVKNEGGILDFVTREIEIECLPGNIPEEIEVDVSKLNIGQHIEASQLELPDKVELLEDPERVILSVSYPTRAAEADEEAEEELLLERESDEPEVIRRGKKDEEDGEEG